MQEHELRAIARGHTTEGFPEPVSVAFATDDAGATEGKQTQSCILELDGVRPVFWQ